MNISPFFWKFSFSVVTIVLMTLGCQNNGDVMESAEPEPSTAAVVDTVTLQSTSFTEYIDLTGVTEPIRGATLSPEVAGRITTYNLEEGATVSKGDTLLQVDARQAGAQIAELQAQIDQAELDVARTERLVERGLSSKQQLEQLRTQRESLKQSKRAAQVGVGNSRLRAPFSGIILEESSELGEYASPGQVVARIGDLSTIKIVLRLPERQIRYVEVGNRADVVIPALEQGFEGEVVRVGSESDSRSRSFPVEIHIDNHDGKIRSGMRADALLSKARYDDALIAPRDVLRQGSSGPEAVLVEDGKAVVRRLELGTAYGRYIMVLSGLDDGDELVIRGQRDLIDGESLHASNQGNCCREQLDQVRRESGLMPEENGDGADDDDDAEEAALDAN